MQQAAASNVWFYRPNYWYNNYNLWSGTSKGAASSHPDFALECRLSFCNLQPLNFSNDKITAMQNKQINPTGNKRGTFFIIVGCASGLFLSLYEIINWKPTVCIYSFGHHRRKDKYTDDKEDIAEDHWFLGRCFSINSRLLSTIFILHRSVKDT